MRPCQLLRLAVTLLFVLAHSTVASPQQTNLAPVQTGKTPPLITQPVDETNLTVLRGNTHPLARPEFDRGAAPPSLPTQRMLLVLKRGAQQESALEQLLDEQQDKSSPNYHAWLAPEQFGQQFGPADEDIQTITSWLQSHGLQVARVANGRSVIEFSGIAAQVKEAFHTEIHHYVVDGEEHWANASDPQIPTALIPVVAGTLTLHNFPRTPMYHLAGLFSREKATGKIQPVKSFITFPGGCDRDNNCYALGPSDFATIYNVLPLWNAAPTPVDGTGQTIAIVGESNINIQDVRDFRAFFGLPANDPQIILDGPDPGLRPDETEADLDVQWSGAVAKGATIKLVLSATTFTTLGVDLSAQYIVDNNVAPIVSESYGECELFIGTAGNQFYKQLWQQAAAQGITAFLSSGDQGSAVCDRRFEAAPQPAQFGLQVSGFSSTPYNISVGGTDFNDLLNPTQFWSTINNSTTQASAKGYIPEVTWNDSCTNAIFSSVGFTGTPEQNCNNPQLAPFVSATGGSGGKSSCTTSDGLNPSTCSGGYAKPSFQTGPGVPNDLKRDVPDVSLFASNGFEGNFYIICEADSNPGATSCDPNAGFSDFVGIGGTSASSPAFAGIMALVEQQTGSRQGNANYVFYKLAAQNSCASKSAPAASCVFYDVTGGTIAMPCAAGSPTCTTKTAGDAFGVLSGFSAGAGYDQATGLGSVNANNLVKSWSSVKFTPSTTALTLNGGNAVNVTHGASVNVSVSVKPTSPEPTGDVSLIAAQGSNSFGFDTMTLANGSASGATNMLPGGASYSVQAHYAGDGTFGGSNSNSVTVTVNPEPSKTNLSIFTTDQNGNITNRNATTFPYGSPYFLRANVTSNSGTLCFNTTTETPAYACPTGTVAITDNGSALGSAAFALNSQGYSDDLTIQLTGGAHNLAGSYSGDNSYDASSTSDPVTVTSATTTTTIVSPVSSVPVQQVILGMPLTISVQMIANGSGVAPTGTYTFFDGTSQLAGTVSTSGFTVPSANEVFFNGTIQTTLSPTSGLHTLTAVYSGDTNYSTSTSAADMIDALFATQTAVSSSSGTIQDGQSVTFTARITPSQSSSVPPAGTITFFAVGSNIGTVSVSNGQAQVTTSSLIGGADFVQAQYSGDVNYASSNGFVIETVNPISTTTSLTTSSATITQGQQLVLTAHISPAQMGVAPAGGSVQFSVNNTPVGNTVNVSNNQAQLGVGFSQTGSVQLQAFYSGDSNYLSSSGTFTETVNPAPDFSISANPGAITISSPGGSGMSMITIAAQNGFTGTVNFSCSGLPSESTCSAPSVNGSGSTTLTVTTTAPSLLVPRGDPNDIGGRPTGRTLLVIALFLGALSLLMRPADRRPRQHPARRWITASALLVFALVAVMSACGGGGGGPKNPGTPLGTTNITVTATGTMNGATTTHTLPITVTVQ
jgi:subtilase family serine protease